MLGFRVWFATEKRFIEWNSFYINRNGEPCDTTSIGQGCESVWMNNPSSEETQKEFIFMQSTGLKDQMGKDLFVKDIIMVGDIHGNFCHAIMLIVESIPQIYNHLMGKYRNRKFSIIGNAMENPELLEKIK